MSRELFKMNMIASVQKLDNEDIEIIQNYIKTIEQENKQLRERIDKTIEYLEKFIPIDENIIILRERQRDYLIEILGDKENINNNAEDIEDLDARITRAEEQYDKQKEEMILGEKE